MSAPYRNFWIIVGITAAAVVLANFSAKPEKPQTVTDRSSYQSTKPLSAPTSSGTLPQRPSASQAPATLPVAGTKPNEAGSTPAVGRQVRSIDEDIKQAFDEATEIALARSIVSSSQPPTETDPKNTELPSLVKREVSERPVAGVSAAPQSTEFYEHGKPARTKTNLNMREGPGPKYVLLETLPTGVTVSVLEEEAGWVRIRLKGAGAGREGWVNPSYLEPN